MFLQNSWPGCISGLALSHPETNLFFLVFKDKYIGRCVITASETAPAPI
jgi:hypothetical protein